MSYSDLNGFSKDSGAGEAEATLLLIARLPAPGGLEDRVQAGLRSAPRKARILSWPGPLPLAGGWLRAAAAAAIVIVVAGGGWGIYSRVQPSQPMRGVAGPHIGGTGGFSEGGAVRRPQTLVGPVVAPPPTAATPKSKVQVKPGVTAMPGAKSIAPNKTAKASAVN